MPESLKRALNRAASQIPRREAEMLAAHVLGRKRAWLVTYPEFEITDKQAESLDLTVELRRLGSPMAYLLSEREFYSRPFQVDQRVLIPRPETETLVEAALARAPAGEINVLDLGTGSGILAITLALERPAWAVTAVDVAASALDCAQANAEALGADGVVFLESDWFAAVAGWCFDLIVANPPYVAADDTHLSQGDLRFEPKGALTDGSADGLASIRTIVGNAAAHLHPGGWLLFEHGFDQAPASRELLAAAGFQDLVSIPDLAGIPRVAAGRKL